MPVTLSASGFWRYVCAALLIVAAMVASPARAQSPDYPRLAHYMGPAPLGDPGLQDYLAKLDWAVVTVWPGWRGAGGVTAEQALRAVKDRSPSTKLFVYVANNEIWDTTDSGDALQEVRSKVDAMGWWLYPAGSSGSRVKSTWGTVHYITNTTSFAPVDSSGRNWNDWFADWSVSTFVTPNPSVDGIFTDNVFWKPRVDGDWNRDGITDSQDSVQTQSWFRAGYRAYFDRMRRAMPAGKMVMGNVADWPEARRAGRQIGEFEGQLNGGVLEAVVGKPYSVESWAGWAEMMRWYRETLAQMADPRLMLFEQFGRIDDYQSMRYGLASCLMDDGYFQYADINGVNGAPWYDEYDVKLGRAISAPPTSAWSNGVYRRDFENGIALVNPKGNGSVTVQLETDYRLVSGRQAPTVNTGALTRSVSLNDRDGIILLRTTPRSRPLPPQRVVVD